MKIQETNDMLNLVELQEALDSTVFEHIDTAQNWEKALANLTALHRQVTDFFQETIHRYDGELPSSNPYWILFLNSAAKVIYFYHFVKQHETAEIDEETKAQLLRGYITASRILPFNLSEDNEEFLAEIENSIQQLDPAMKLEHATNTLPECFETLHTYKFG